MNDITIITNGQTYTVSAAPASSNDIVLSGGTEDTLPFCPPLVAFTSPQLRKHLTLSSH